MRAPLFVPMAVAFLILWSGLAVAQSPKPAQKPAGQAPHSATVSAIRAAHHLDCGVVTEADDWNRTDLHGNLSALGSEICRAVAIAVLGSADAAKIHDFPAEPEALTALQSGTIQLAAMISPDTTIATRYGVGFGPPVFYDTQRIMLSRGENITTLAGLRDKLICVLDMTQPEQTLRDEMSARGIPYAVMAHSEQGEMDAAVAVSHCSAGTEMESRLAESRQGFHAMTSQFVFLPDRFGLEPVVPAYRYGDQVFGLIVDWTVYALIEAEALGITKANVAAAARQEDMRAEQLLGGDFATAQSLGLTHDWAAKVIAALGNYGEIFERTVGGPYHLDRGLNRLWTDGGLMRPLPMR